jgi:formyl-CoA transferase
MELVKDADVIIENMRVNVKHRLGIDYETVKKVNPRIVYASISGFGQTGPYKDRAGVDQIVQGMAGLMSITGLPGQGPVRAGIPVVDLCAGAFIVQAILIALLDREVIGVGRWVHTSLLESMIAMLDFQAARWLIREEVAEQAGNNHPTAIPTGLYPTLDGQILIGAGSDRLWKRLCEALGAENWFEDARFATASQRLQHRDELNDEISKLTRARTSEHWSSCLNDAGVPCGSVNTIDKVFSDKQVRHVGMTLTADHPILGSLSVVAQPTNIEGFDKSIRIAPCTAGEHTDDVLRSLDYADSEIADLRARNIV